MRLKQVMEKATKGPLSVTAGFILSAPHRHLKRRRVEIGSVRRGHEADAPLLAHWYNVGPKLVEALEAYFRAVEQNDNAAYIAAVTRLEILTVEANEVQT